MSNEYGDEAALIANAQGVIGDGEVVRHAGVFNRPAVNNGMINGDVLGGVTGALIGGVIAHEHEKQAGLMTMRLIVAVTDEHIHVINWGDAPDPDRIAHTFDRATTKVTTHHIAAARTLKLVDTETGVHIKLDGTAGRMLSQSGPDTAVIEALAS